MRNTFNNVQIGAGFWCNGNYYIKRSTRTADMWRDDTRQFYCGWFYMRMGDLCTSRRNG